MEKAKLKNSLIWRLSLGLLMMLFILGVSYVLITANAGRTYYQQTTQKLNAAVAKQMLLEVQPFENGKVNEEAVGIIMHSMMAVNPGIEVYLLDPAGQILSYVVLDKKVRLKNIDLAPVKDFIASDGLEFILGDDPRQPGNKTVFSATAVTTNDELQGYVYIVLASEKYETIAEAFSTGFFLKVGTTAFLITLFGAFLIGVLLIYFLTKNLRIIIQTVKRFEDGDYKARIPIHSNDEIAVIGRTFNQMADSILANMEDLKQVDHLRRELIANVSHDIRSPMAVIHGYIDTLLIKAESLKPEEQKKYLQIALRSSEKLKKLVADLFELSKLESQQMEVHRQSVKLQELLEASHEEFSLMAAKKKIDFQVKIDPMALPVMADIGLMQRVIQNLLENAIKYTPENGSVRLEAISKSNKLELAISNTGAGIKESEIPHLFDRFYRSDERIKTEAALSSGLGLAIVKKILEIHDSVIQVRSEKDGLTTFWFSLPFVTAV